MRKASERRRTPQCALNGSDTTFPAVTRLRDRGKWRYSPVVWSSASAAGTTVIGLRLNWRCWRTAFVALGCAAVASVAPVRAADVDPSNMSADATKALEQRLTDAGCYKGAIDGTASGALDAAIKACPDQRPFLRIETGMHTAEINRVGVDAACSLLATASDDKTVRLWSLPDGKFKRVVRLPIGDGNAGKVYATALSPDGRWLAAGGWDAGWEKTGTMSLMVVDLAKDVIQRFGGFESAIDHLAFSADGRRIAVGLHGNNGVRVLDSATGGELLADQIMAPTSGASPSRPTGR